MRYRGGVLSLQANDSGSPATSLGYYVPVNGKADLDLANINVADGPLEYTVLRTKLTEVQEACRPADIAVPSSII